MSKHKPKVFLDVAIGTRQIGRMIFELFTDLTPKTSENFRGLCTGEYGNVGLRTTTKKLCYRNSTFHRVIDGFMIQGGDFTRGDGTGGHSIYGARFNDENFQRTHSCAGLLSMANAGRNTNGSQFFITLEACPHLDGKHVVFGQIISGMEVVRKIAKVPVNEKNKPKIPVTITDCGEVGDNRDFLTYDPFKKEELEQMQKINRKNVLAFEEKPQDPQDDINPNLETEEQQEEHTSKNEDEIVKKLRNEVEDYSTEDPLLGKRKIKKDKLERLRAIKLKINDARKKNLKAVIDEDRKNSNVGYIHHLKKQEDDEWKKKREAELEFKGLKNQKYMDRPALKQKEIKKKNADLSKEDKWYRAYDRRIKSLPFYKEVYQKQMETGDENYQVSKDKLEHLKKDLEEQHEKNRNYRRRRMFDPEEEVDYINERNREFNKKLRRHYGKYAEEVKANLERGSALQ